MDIFGSISRSLVKIGITANQMTSISFLMAMLAVYFLFVKNNLFVVFVLLHFFCDILDGEIARLTKATRFGSWFDYFTDRSVVVLLLIKTYFYLGINDMLYWSALGLFFVHHILYLMFKRKIIILYSRSFILILFMFKIYVEAFVVLLTINSFGIVLQMVNLILSRKQKKKKK